MEGHLDSFVRGIVPTGFQKIPRSIPKRTADSLEAYGSGYWMLGREEVMVYEVENTSDQPVTLSPDLFLLEGEQAVTFDRSAIPPRGRARMAVLFFGTGQAVSFPPVKSSPVFGTPFSRFISSRKETVMRLFKNRGLFKNREENKFSGLSFLITR